MKKWILITLAIVFGAQSIFANEELRNYAPVKLSKGAFLKAVNQREISTSIVDEGDVVTFISPTDVWIGENKVIPKSSVFYGVVEELHEPVQGTNASIRLRINKVVFPDGDEFPLDGYITHKGDSKIGGELTPPMEYAKMPHHIRYPRVYKGVLQYTPGVKRFFGNHTVIKSGAELVLQLESDFSVVGSVNNWDY